MQSGAVVVDDRSSQIDYTTEWYNNVIGQGTDYNQTVSVSGNQNAGFQFTFLGTSIAVYGSIPPNNTAVSAYIIDFSAPVSYTNVPSSVYTSRHLCFQSPTLPYGEHTLVVDIPESTIGHDWTQFYFDFLTYIPSNSSAEATSDASLPTASSSGSSAVSPTGAAAEQTTASSSSSKPALRTILPAVLVPCIICIALLALALFVMRRRMRRATPHAPETSARPFFAGAPTTPHTPKGPTSAPSSSSSALSSALPALPSGGGSGGGGYSDSVAELSPGAALSPTAVVSPAVAFSPAAATTPGGGDGMARVREWAHAGGSVGAPSVATQEPPPVYMP